MIKGILSFQFVFHLNDAGVIEPEIRPLQLVFQDKKYNKNNYSDLLVINDLFTVFYQHTTGAKKSEGAFTNFFMGRLKKTAYEIVSYFREENDGTQFLTILIFELDDETEIFMDLIKNMASKLDSIFPALLRAANSRNLSLIETTNTELREQIKLTMFHIERLSNLDKLQKVGLIFSNEARLDILKTLRVHPHSRRELKKKIERERGNVNLDILIEPFLELNIIRRDWIKGDRKRRKKDRDVLQDQGEYVFLTKDVLLVQIPSPKMIKLLKEKEPSIFPTYRRRVNDFFSNYNPNEQEIEKVKKLAKLLLNPDMYDFLALMRENYYPLDKIPKILSEWAETNKILETLQDLSILTVIDDNKKKKWLVLLTDITPLIVFPEYLLPNIRMAFIENTITREVAVKAFTLLEATFPDNIEF